MGDRTLTKQAVILGALALLRTSTLLAQEASEPSESFDVEPPLLVPPRELTKDVESSRDGTPLGPLDLGKLAEQLERAHKSAASAERLVRMGVLAKTEAEQRALRVIRLEATLADAQVVAAQEQVAVQQARSEAGLVSQKDLDAATAALAQANAAAQVAAENYRQAQLKAAALNLRRQKQLLAQGSARKADVARAEEKLATLQQGDEPAR